MTPTDRMLDEWADAVAAVLEMSGLPRPDRHDHFYGRPLSRLIAAGDALSAELVRTREDRSAHLRGGGISRHDEIAGKD